MGELYYKEDLEVYQRKTKKALNLRLLTSQHSALTDSYVEIKLQFQVALDQNFPEYHSVFSDLYGKTIAKYFIALSNCIGYSQGLSADVDG